MIYGIGTDIVAIERFQRFIDSGNSAVIKRIFTPSELTFCESRKDVASGLAGRFAAKEAFLKALGTGLREGISWQEMVVTNDVLGKPEMKLSGKAEEFFVAHELHRIHLSLSHDGGNAVAMVVLESN